MRVLFTIAHYFNSEGGGFYGSLKSDPTPRIKALQGCIAALHQNFSTFQGMLDGSARRILPSNTKLSYDIDVVVCTNGENHLLYELDGIAHLFTHHTAFVVEPMLLGFECHEIMSTCYGQYDYYAYLEDDLQIDDPYFLEKIKWFNTNCGDEFLLQPNRYEVDMVQPMRKLYIDGNLVNPEMTKSIQDVTDSAEISREYLGAPLRFGRVNNPHSGCFFLNNEQLKRWIDQPYFLDRDTSFAGPLESAATLGITKAFKIYKPLAENAAFLEIRHLCNRYLGVRIRADHDGKWRIYS